MSAASNFVPVPGSEPRSLANLRVLGPAPPDETIQVTVYVRRKKISTPTQRVRQLPVQRRHLTRAEFDAQLGADPQDLELIESFAHRNGLAVLEASIARGSVTLSGTVAAFSKAFGVNIVHCEFHGHVYRQRTGTIKVPAELAEVVLGVFGLENLPIAQPR